MKFSFHLLSPLLSRYCLFGEWLWSRHSIGYNELPDFLLTFDILDKTNNQFLCYEKMMTLIDDKFNVVPVLRQWKVNVTETD
jgi:hypothetical protein